MRWLPYAKNHRVLEYKSPVHVHTHRERETSKQTFMHTFIPHMQIVQPFLHCLFTFQQTISLPLSAASAAAVQIYNIMCNLVHDSVFSSGFQLPFSLYTSSLYHLNTKKIHQKFFLRCCENKIFKITRKYWVTVVVEWKVEKLDAETRLRKKDSENYRKEMELKIQMHFSCALCVCLLITIKKILLHEIVFSAG